MGLMLNMDIHLARLRRFPLGLGPFPSGTFGIHDALDHPPSDLQLIVVGELFQPEVLNYPVPLEVLLKLISRVL